MKNFYFTALLAGATLFLSPVASAQLVINELMQSNIDCIMDDLNEFPDSWVELYNAGTKTVDLSDYKLGTSEKLKKAYKLPQMQVAPGEFIVIYCDKEETGLHTSFRLESGKDGCVYLFHNDEIVEKLENMKKQPAPNIAYGRKTDGGEEWGYQAVPTPGKANCGTLCKDLLGDPVFSETGKVFSDNLELVLSLPEGAPEGAEIRYTKDGQEPTTTAIKYKEPIKITSTTVIRAKIFCEGYLSPRSVTHSYIKHPRDLSLPLVSIVTDKKYFYDSKIGIYVEGTYTPGTANYQYDWRRPVNYEYFEEAGKESVINQLCETRVKGGATRGSQLKSLAVYANKRFGEKRFKYEFFPDQTPGIDEFKSFEMRNSGNDFDYLYMRDAIIQRSMGMNADLDWQPSRPVIIYINGEYKGILNIRPRSNEDYVYSYYNGLEDVDVIENWNELKEGEIDRFNEFKAFYAETGHSYEEFETWMDTGEFCNLMVMNMFYDNKDFPGNNLILWRPQADGGKWRWIAKDTDFGLGLYGARSNYPTLSWLVDNNYDKDNKWGNVADATRLFRRLIDTPEFKDMYIDRCAVYMGDFLTSDIIRSLIDQRYQELKGEYKFHRDLINPWWPTYDVEISNAKTWVRERWTFFYNHLADFFKLEKPVVMTVDKDKNNGRKLSINNVELVGDEFNGKYFPGRKLCIKSVSDNDGLYVSGWKVSVTNSGKVTTETYNTETLDIEMPKGTKVVIETILSVDPASVNEIAADFDPAIPCEIFDLSGRCVGTTEGRNLGNTVAGHFPELIPGVYILRQGSASRKVIVK